jgi:hypothetical protein
LSGADAKKRGTGGDRTRLREREQRLEAARQARGGAPARGHGLLLVDAMLGPVGDEARLLGRNCARIDLVGRGLDQRAAAQGANRAAPKAAPLPAAAGGTGQVQVDHENCRYCAPRWRPNWRRSTRSRWPDRRSTSDGSRTLAWRSANWWPLAMAC